jgi:sugar diacid utilization regulator
MIRGADMNTESGRSGTQSIRLLARMRELYALSVKMSGGRTEEDILQLAVKSVLSLSSCQVEAVYHGIDGALVRRPGVPAERPDPDAEISRFDGNSPTVSLEDGRWRKALGLGDPTDVDGCIVVSADAEPPKDQIYLLDMLAHQTGLALRGAALVKSNREHSAALAHLTAQLTATTARLQRQTRIQEVLAAVPADRTREQGIVDALHEVTELSVAVEDRFGNLRTWSGPLRPDPYPKESADVRTQLLHDLAAAGQPVRVADRVMALVQPGPEVLGVIALSDPARRLGEDDLFAFRYATKMLALGLAHQLHLAQMELRLRRDLVADLLAGTEDISVFARAAALGHDLHGLHHVVVVRSAEHSVSSTAGAASRAAASLVLDCLQGRQDGFVVLLVRGKPNPASIHNQVGQELGADCVIGVGGRCQWPGDFPRSFDEARRALHVRENSQHPDGATSFEELGFYRLLNAGEHEGHVVDYIREWLSVLLDYDERRHTELVSTLSQYLESGGNYDDTAAALFIHRSTLRYRLSRIRKLTDLDLSDADVRFNLQVATRAWQVLRGG